MTAPQERPVAGDGLDREAVRRCIEASKTYADPRMAFGPEVVPALFDALEAAEAEVARLRTTWTPPQDDEAFALPPLRRTHHVGRVLRTEGGAS